MRAAGAGSDRVRRRAEAKQKADHEAAAAQELAAMIAVRELRTPSLSEALAALAADTEHFQLRVHCTRSGDSAVAHPALELGEGVANTDAGTGAERTVRFAHLSMLACVEINQ